MAKTLKQKQQDRLQMSAFQRPVPGYGLTRPKEKMPWRKPPKYTNAGDAVEAVIDSLESTDRQEEILKVMLTGISIETLVSSITKSMFAEGVINPDVGITMQAPLSVYLMGLASKANIPVKVFATKDGMPRKKYGMKDSQILNLMRSRNPELAAQVFSQPELVAKASRGEFEEEAAPEPTGFIGMEPEAVDTEV